MKKLITIILATVMLVSVFALSSSAAGSILFEDDFSDGFTNANNWYLEGNLFFGDDMSEPGNPCLSAYADGVVCQMEYRYDHSNTPRLYAESALSVDVRMREYDRDDGEHLALLWWRENFLYTPEGEEIPEGYEEGPVYAYGIDFDAEELYLDRSDTEGHLITVPVPGIRESDEWFNLGWRLTKGKIEIYFEKEKVGELNDAGITCQRPSPFLLWNINCFLSYDNLVVSTPDYDLFNEGLGQVTTAETEAPVVDDTTAGTDTPVVDNTDIGTDAPAVDDTNADTDAPAADDTNAPSDDSDAPADTVGTTGTQKPSTSTGDAMVLVVVMMVAALGSAVIAKKVNSK